MYAYVYLHLYLYIYIYTHTYLYTHIYVYVCIPNSHFGYPKCHPTEAIRPSMLVIIQALCP